MDYLKTIPKELEDLLSSLSGSIAIAMSGGVDSSVVAMMFKDRGLKITGYVMQHTNDNAVLNAQYVADQLNIKLNVLDLRKEFHEEVIKYFIEDYTAGRTPNPCVVCNAKIKFGTLMNKALEDNNWFATGHYIKKYKINGRFTVGQPEDINKDQSYALSMLTQNQLSRLIFPLGYLEKREVKQIAEQNGLEIKQKGESVDLCFTNDRKQFLKQTTEQANGIIRNTKGEIIGKHNGIQYYAIGQRRHLGLDDGPYYVKEIDDEKNEIIVGNHNDLYKKEFQVNNVNWLLPYQENVQIIVRNKMEPQPCKIYIQDENERNCNVKVIMEDNIWAPAPGQLAVFYDKSIVIGGGWIEE